MNNSILSHRDKILVAAGFNPRATDDDNAIPRSGIIALCQGILRQVNYELKITNYDNISQHITTYHNVSQPYHNESQRITIKVKNKSK
jgi:hypothetical protein